MRGEYPYKIPGGPNQKRERVIVRFKGVEQYRGEAVIYRANNRRAVRIDGMDGKIIIFDVAADVWSVDPEEEERDVA